MLNLLNQEFKKLTRDQFPKLTKRKFQTLDLGDVFCIGVSEGMGANKGAFTCEMYKKISKSEAEIIATPGFMNRQFIGDIHAFSSQSIVFTEVD